MSIGLAVAPARLVALVLAAGCGEAVPERGGLAGPWVPPPERPALGHVRLAAASDAPLGIAALVEVEPGQYVTSDPFEPVLWRLHPTARGSEPRRLARVVPERTRILAAAGGPSGIGVLLADRRLLVWSPAAGGVVARHRLPASLPGQLHGLHGLADGSWVELRTEMEDGPLAGMRLALVRHIPGQAEEEPLWRAAAGGPWQAALDGAALGATADTLYVSRALPPRLARIDAARPGSVAEMRLRGVPHRPMPERLRREVAVEIERSPASAGRVPTPTAFPAVLRVWPRDTGLIVKAITGEDSVGLDWYCAGAYRRTLVASPALRSAHVVGNAIALLLAEDPAGDHVLAFYSVSQFPLDCPPTDG